MNLNYNYWYFQNAFSPEQCDRIIKMGMQEDFELGDINRNKVEKVKEEEKKDLFKTRNSHISWIDQPWIYNILKKYIDAANAGAGWNFQWDWTEMLQFTKYDVGQF